MLDLVAREAGLEPFEVRMKNLVRPEQMPFDNITKKHFDSGDYPEALRRALDAADLKSVRERQKRGEPDGRLIGIGLAVYCEQGAHGTSVYAGWGIPMVPGHEQATARMTPDGGLELRVGVHSHGQSMETTLAQVAHEILGIEIAKIKLVHGDTEYTPYSTGSWGSRSAVMAGGAVATATGEVARCAKAIGAHLLQTDAESVALRDGAVHGPSGSVTLAEIAHTWYRRPQDLPASVDPRGLEATIGYKPGRDSGTFSYAAHVATVAVDLQHRRHREDFAYRLCHATSARRVGEVNHDNGFAPAQRFEGRRERRVAAQRARPRRYAAARALPDEDLPAGQRAAPELLQPLRAVGDEKDGDPRARWRSTFTSFGHVSSPPPHPPHQGPEAMMYFASYRAMASWITRMAASLFSHPTIWTRLPSRSL